MSPEPQPKRDSLTGWFIGVGVLLLLAAAVPVAYKLYGLHELVFGVEGITGEQISWRCDVDGAVQTGVTNLPAKLAFRGRNVTFTAERTNHVMLFKVDIWRDGTHEGEVDSYGNIVSLRSEQRWNGQRLSGVP